MHHVTDRRPAARRTIPIMAVPLLVLAIAGIAQGQVTTVTFDDGAEGWVGPGGPGGSTFIESTGGNPGANLRTVFNNFGISFTNGASEAFLGDYTTADEIEISIDIRVDEIGFFGQAVSRPWLVELRDFDTASGGYPYTSVWYLFANISAAANGSWQTYSVTFDPSSETLPSGWGGTGAEDPDTFEPILPPNVTFAEVLSGVDVAVFTTLQPGFFFGFTDFDLRLDNITIARNGGEPSPDLDGNGTVDGADLTILLSAWGDCAKKAPCPADLDGDGGVDGADLTILLAAWE